MAEPAPLRVDDALDDLVNQFADPFSFLRELVQNALDAGSDEVEISVSFEAGEGDKGVAIVKVEDWGEGMTREVIEKRLTRLFSSSKDGDMTKIGKFGIGFVSVFAIQPQAVCIDTSRDGQNWRVLFDEHRRFKLLRLDTPVDGTKIQILKSMTRKEHERFVARAGETLRYWCKHTRGEIHFMGQLVNEPFGLTAPCRVERNDGFSHVVVGHPLDRQGFYGLYNNGLTLMEGGNEYFDAIAFKVSSPHLEHTLTRDNVIRDKGYERVMGTVRELVHDELCRRVFADLEEELRRPTPSSMRDHLYRCALWHAMNTADLTGKVGDEAAFVSPSGQMVTVVRARRSHAQNVVLLASTRSPLSDAAEAEGLTVIAGPAQGPVRELAQLLAPHGTKTVLLEEAYALPLPARDDAEVSRWAALRTATQRLIEAWGGKVSGVELGHFAYEGSGLGEAIAITMRGFGKLTACSELDHVGQGFLSRPRVLVINGDHPTVKSLVRLSATEPEFAAYLLVKLFFLGSRLDVEVDGLLARATVELRAAR